MYCPNCGNQIDGHNFCPNCGAPSATTAVTTAPNNDRLQQRKSELQLMDHMIEYFSQKQFLYNEYDNTAKTINRLRRGVSKSPLVWGIILIAISEIFFSFVLSILSDLVNSFNSLELCACLFVFFILVCCLGGGVALIVLFIKRTKKNNALISEKMDRYSQISDELYVHYCGYENCPIGHEYTNPSNLEVIKQTIISGRADTIKDALNILVEDAHRARIENYTAQTANYARQTAHSARATAIFTAAHFFEDF